MTDLNVGSYRLESISTFDQTMVILLVLALLCSLVFSYQRIVKRSPFINALKPYLHFFIVSAINVIASLTLLFLILDIGSLSEDKSRVIVLTSGTSQQQVNSLNVTTSDDVYVLPQYINSLNLDPLMDQIIFIDHVGSIALIDEHPKSIKVYGDGLLLHEWLSLSSKSIDFIPSPNRTGVTTLNWPKEINIGELFKITGTFQTKAEHINKTYKLILKDFHGEEVDSVNVNQGDRFSLTSQSKVAGLFTYQLQVLDDSEQVITSETVAFEVKNNQLVNIAIKQSAPSFETRHLKNWAAEHGSKMLLLTQVSQNNNIQQTVNDNDSSIADSKGTLAIDWLNKFDLLILDGRSFSHLTQIEINVLEQAVTEGLGLLILADESLITLLNNHPSKLLKGIELGEMTELNALEFTVPSWFNSIERLQLDYGRYILSTDKGNVLVKGDDGNNLVVNRELALGKVAVSLLSQTYQWSISDNKVHYSHYWHYLISQISRNKSQNYWQGETSNKVSYMGLNKLLCAHVDEQTKFNVFSEQVKLTPLVERLALRCGHYWPESSGWHHFILKDKEQKYDEQSRFVYQATDWLVWQQKQKNKISAQFVQQQPKSKHVQYYHPIDQTLYWIIFFLSASCLWIEQKVFNR
jgi:hypothetical protein